MKLLIISIPFFSSLSIYFFGRYIGYKGAKLIGISSILFSSIISFICLYKNIKGEIYILKIKEWFNIGLLNINIEMIYDKESLLMSNLISIITFIVITYSFWYLSEDPHINRFISYLLIFSVSMFILVTSKNFLLTFLGWEGVGIVSYLLINFWFISPNNNKSAIKAFLFNKVGDISYLFALLILSIIYYNYDILSFNNPLILFSNITYIKYILLFFLIAAIAKSAQIFLHCWLGDAMAGPTPVSALLHAATMVTAGIFIIIRCNNILIPIEEILNENIIKNIIIIIGGLTIIFAGLSSMNQYDIKKVIAFSTCAQIGFMFFALILYMAKYASLFHLITHGFFKALLFLSAGLLIHNFFLEQDLRKFGSFIFSFPLFYIFFLIGTFTIIAIPPLSGFYSKENILIHSLLSNNLSLFILLLIGSLFSSFYSFKILINSFFNSFSSSSSLFFPLRSQSSSYSFLYPFIFLILGSIFLGSFSSSFFLSLENISLDLEVYINSSSYLYKIIPFFLPFFTFFFFLLSYHNYNFAYWFKFVPFYNYFYFFFISLFNRRFFFDTLYNFFLVLPTFFASYHIFYKFIDRGFLEFFGPLGFFRLFFYFPSFFAKEPKGLGLGFLSYQSSSNLPYLFFYMFISFLLLFFFFYLI